MSVSSLTKFTVPLDSDQSANAQGLLMPKLKYRFRALFENLGVSTPRTELTKQVKENNYFCSCIRSFTLVSTPPFPLYPPNFPSDLITL